MGQLKWLESSGQDSGKEEVVLDGFPNVYVWVPCAFMAEDWAVPEGEGPGDFSEWLPRVGTNTNQSCTAGREVGVLAQSELRELMDTLGI